MVLTVLLLTTVLAWAVTKQEVVCSFRFDRRMRIATNQYAIWIENKDGVLVRTLFVTAYTAGKGWKKRLSSLPEWRKAVGSLLVDGVSGATPKSGVQQVVWDLRDAQGVQVADGQYLLRFEGNLGFETYLDAKCMLRISGEEVSASSVDLQVVGKPPLEQKMISDLSVKVRNSGKSNMCKVCL